MTKFTKLIGFIAILSLWTTPAKAQFVFLGENDRGTSLYINDRIHHNGSFVWYITQFVERDNFGQIINHYQSLRSGDCRTGATRIRKIWTFIENYQTVNSVHDSDDNYPLNYPSPDSLGYAALSYACNN